QECASIHPENRDNLGLYRESVISVIPHGIITRSPTPGCRRSGGGRQSRFLGAFITYECVGFMVLFCSQRPSAAVSSRHSRGERPLDAWSTCSPASMRRMTARPVAEIVAAFMRYSRK